MKGRNPQIQMLRGLAIISVVLIHTCPRGEWQVYGRPFFNFGVPLFLFISGFLTDWNRKDWLAFYRKRGLRVVIPYVIWTVIYTLMRLQPERLVFNFITTQGAFHLYFIFVYLQFVLLTPIIGRLAKSRFRWVGWIIAPLSLIAFNYIPFFLHLEIPDRLSLIWAVACLGWFSFYYLGLCFRNDPSSLQSIKPTTWGAMLLFCMVLQFIEGRFLLNNGYYDPGTPLKLSTLLFNTVLLFGIPTFLQQSTSLLSHPLIFLGDGSFGIYLSHVLFLWGIAYVPVLASIPFPINSMIVLSLSSLFVYSIHRITGDRVSRWIGFS